MNRELSACIPLSELDPMIRSDLALKCNFKKAFPGKGYSICRKALLGKGDFYGFKGGTFWQKGGTFQAKGGIFQYF